MKESQKRVPLSDFQAHETAPSRGAAWRKRGAYFLSVMAFVSYGSASAQNPPSPATQQPNSAKSSAAAKPNDQSNEENGVQILKEKLLHDYSDQTGRPRPDLILKAIAHLKGMKVANQIGASTK